jgi:SAM-dependent methyltransferase
MPHEDETAAFWSSYTHDDLATRTAVLVKQRRDLESQIISAARKVFSDVFIRGAGIEIGAGTRPFPLPPGVQCFYGDSLDHDALAQYFSSVVSAHNGRIDAQSFQQVEFASQDFIIMAHVIEHLENPIGSIDAAIKRLKPRGTLLLVAPNRERTFDCRRQGTPLSHLICDAADGGLSTRYAAIVEHLKYVHPELTGETLTEQEIHRIASLSMREAPDLHYHAWNIIEFREFCDYCATRCNANVVGHSSVATETIIATRRS